MIVRLDPLHRLDFSKGYWTLSILQRVAPHTKEKEDKFIKEGKPHNIIEDEDGKKVFALWKMINTYATSNLSQAMEYWAGSLIASSMKDKDIDLKKMVKILKLVEKRLIGMRALSSLVRIKFEMDLLTEDELKHVNEEIKKKDRIVKADIETGKRRTMQIGPELMFVPVVINRIDEKKAIKIVNNDLDNLRDNDNDVAFLGKVTGTHVKIKDKIIESGRGGRGRKAKKTQLKPKKKKI